LTKRAYEKPRKYAGDAVMLDYVYYGIPSHEEVTKLGQTMCHAVRQTAPCAAVRNRAVYIGRLVDRMVEQRQDNSQPFRVLSIAAGHGREISLSEAFKRKEVSFTAVDLDIESLKQMQRDYGEFDVEVHPWHVKNLLEQECQTLLGQFDLVYSCGLYDYLPDNFAQKLTAAIASRLVKPGGKLVVVNFVDHYFRNFMEVFMDWHLIYRDVASLERLTHVISPSIVKKKAIFKDASDAVLYVEIDFCEAEIEHRKTIEPTFYEVFNFPLHHKVISNL